MARKRKFAPIDDCKIGISGVDPIERVGLLARQFGPGEIIRTAPAQLTQQLQLWAAFADHHARTVQAGDVPRRRVSAALHDQLLDFPIGCGREPGPFPALIGGELRGGNVDTALGQ